MATSYDDDITLNVGLNPDDALATSERLSEAINNIFDRARGQQFSTQLRNILSQFNTLEQRAEQIREYMDEIATLRQLGISVPGMDERYERLGQQLANISNQITIARSRLDDLGAKGDETANSLSRVFSASARPQITNILDMLRIALQRVASAAVNVSRTLITTLASGTVNIVIASLKKLAEWAKTAAINLAKLVASGIIKGIKSLGSAMLGLGRHTSSASDTMKHALRNFIRYGLGMRSLFALINKIRRALADGLSQLADAYEPFGNVVSEFRNAVELLKGSLASMIAPILQQALPAVTAFINKLAEGISVIGKFIAALQGKSIFIKATSAVAKTSDQATKSLKNTAKAAKEAQRELFGFDQINRFSKQNDDSDSGDSGSGAGDDSAGGITFEEVPIESAIKNLADKIRAFIQSEDWEGLGTFLGESINSVFRKAYEFLSSEQLYDKIDYIIHAITTTFNALVSAIDWPLIGRTFAAGINLIIHSINELVTGINWYNLGNGITTGLTRMILLIHWDELGQMFGNLVNSVIDFLYGAVQGFNFDLAAMQLTTALNNFISTVNWQELGQLISEFFVGVLNFLSTTIADFDWEHLVDSILEFLSGVEWSRIVDGVCRLIGTAFGQDLKLKVYIWNKIIKPAWDKVMEYWVSHIKEAGGDLWKGLTTGISQGFSRIRSWLKEHVFTPFMNAFKDLFGIASPSTVLSNMGKYLIEGLHNGITDALRNIRSWVESHIFEPFMTPINTFFKIASGKSGVTEETGGDIINGLYDGTNDSGTISSISGIFSSLVLDIQGSFNGISWWSIGSSICEGIYSGLEWGWNWLTTSAWNLATSIYNSACRALGINSPSKVFREGVGMAIPEGIAVGIDKYADLATSSVNDLSKSIANSEIQMPSVVAGKVVPYSAGQGDTSIIDALNNMVDMLEYNQTDNISKDDLETILTNVIRRNMNITFYMGDEEVARHANAGNAKLDSRFNPSIA